MTTTLFTFLLFAAACFAQPTGLKFHSSQISIPATPAASTIFFLPWSGSTKPSCQFVEPSGPIQFWLFRTADGGATNVNTASQSQLVPLSEKTDEASYF